MSTNEHPDYITVTSGMRGFFAVHLSWEEDLQMYTPWQSGIGSYKTSDEAAKEGRSWAKSEGIEFKL